MSATLVAGCARVNELLPFTSRSRVSIRTPEPRHACPAMHLRHTALVRSYCELVFWATAGPLPPLSVAVVVALPNDIAKNAEVA